MTRRRHPPSSALALPTCTVDETRILQLRARGWNYRQIATETRIAPRKVWDMECAALAKVLRYLETVTFLGG